MLIYVNCLTMNFVNKKKTINKMIQIIHTHTHTHTHIYICVCYMYMCTYIYMYILFCEQERKFKSLEKIYNVILK